MGKKRHTCHAKKHTKHRRPVSDDSSDSSSDSDSSSFYDSPSPPPRRRRYHTEKHGGGPKKAIAKRPGGTKRTLPPVVKKANKQITAKYHKLKRGGQLRGRTYTDIVSAFWNKNRRGKKK